VVTRASATKSRSKSATGFAELRPPRVGSRRHPRRATLGGVLAGVASTMGLTFHPWQRHIGDVSLELVERRRPGSRRRLAAGTVGVMASRQTGKSAWCAARVAMQALLPDLPSAAALVGLGRVRPQHVAYLAQDRMSALGRWHEHVDALMASPLAEHVAKVVLQRGDEAVKFHNGSTYQVVTPSRTGARGLSLDLVIIDEALAHTTDLLAAVRPTMAQRDGAVGCIGAQLVIVSNAGDERSTLLNEQRELGRRAALEGDIGRVWFEWSAPDDADPFDEDVWRRTIPTLEQPDGIGLEFVRMEAESMRLDDFRREYLCVHTHRPVARVIDPYVWGALPADEIDPAGRVVLAVDAPRDRSSAVVVGAGRLGDEGDAVIALEVVEQRQGAEWVAGYVAALAVEHQAPVVVDAYGPMASLIPLLKRSPGVRVRGVKVGDVVDAAAGLCDLIAQRRIAHMRDPRLDDAVAAVGRRKVGDRWAFNRTGTADISPLVAASLAVWAVDAGAFPRPHIY
jgi:hypothetical protein